LCSGEKPASSRNTFLLNVSFRSEVKPKAHIGSQDEYVVFITPTRVQTKILMKILAKDNLDPLIKNSMSDSLAMVSLLQKICNSPILLKATADKNKGKENQGVNSGAISDALAYLPARPQVEDVSLSGLAYFLCLIGMQTDASIRETYGTR
jgi:DNA repair and recombination protein RAD54B